MKILIVDDEPDVIKVITMSFQMHQPAWEVVGAPDGAEALERFDTDRPDVVLLDVGLPEMSGFEVLRRIRLFSDVPVIMLTVKDDEMSKVQGLELGADDYVTKPFGHLELLARVRAVLRRAEALPLAHEQPLPAATSRSTFPVAGHRRVSRPSAPSTACSTTCP